jgi:uncharacterized membrane protein
MKFLIFILFILSCTKSYDLGDSEQVNVKITDAELATPTWSSPVYQIVEAKCATCHTRFRDQFVPANTPSDLDDLLDENFFNANRNEVWDRIIDSENPMPPTFSTPLTLREKEALKNYIDSFNL